MMKTGFRHASDRRRQMTTIQAPLMFVKEPLTEEHRGMLPELVTEDGTPVDWQQLDGSGWEVVNVYRYGRRSYSYLKRTSE
ncbi:MAG: hypothetical protein AAF787_13965 [Chloroflexota bacterium]